MRNLCVVAGLALLASNALAADFGVGISVRSDDGWLYVPVNVAKSLRIEPSVRYSSAETTLTQSGTDNRQKNDILELGVGVFGLKQVTEAAHIYYGGRLSYVDMTSSGTDVTSLGTVIRSQSDQDGYRIGPTLGFEYLFGGQFSVGGEASYTFLELEGKARSRVGNLSSSTADFDQSSQGTQTRLIFRYMF
ncbi:hypothetical protein [Steroidobacter cummioxidans]|uniref:hypothetical protein n=1 Tax=Steroidobacter cummioxidans TaxID=1803913 RepID=UPI0012904257|nr:hypothetical protein [Steroidobacter cummioxidans]